MHDVPVDFKDKSVVGLAPQDWEQGRCCCCCCFKELSAF